MTDQYDVWVYCGYWAFLIVAVTLWFGIELKYISFVASACS